MAKDILKDPEPVKGAGKSVVDAVLSAVRVGNALMYLLSGLLAAVLMIYSGYILYDTIATDYKAYTSSWELMRYKPDAAEEDPTEGQELLSDINEDYRAWLTIYDTTIDYPVVQGRDNLYYASHDIYRNASLTGAIYLAAENKADFTDSYNLVYGHHMDNGAMFGSLDSFADQDYFNAHKYGVIVTPSGGYDIELFAVVSTDAYENQIYTVGNRAKEVLTFLTGDRTNDVGVGTKIRVFDEKAAKNAAKIIALSTCSDAETNGRLVVFGKMTYRGMETPTPAPSAKPTVKPTAVPTATPEPEEKTVTLIIRYMNENGEVFPTKMFVLHPGDGYTVPSPVLSGYDVDKPVVQGVILEDTEVVVWYTPRLYRLRISYIYTNGTVAAEEYTESLKAGDPYKVKSPDIDGYTASMERVEGVNPGMDEQYTVIYIAEGESLEDVTDKKTTAPGDTVCIQVGICFE